MENENKPQTHSRTVNDVVGLGEAVKSIFSFFEKIIDKLPFEKLTGAQTQFIIILVIVNLLTVVLAIFNVIEAFLVYIVLSFDLIMAGLSFYLTQIKRR